MKIIYLLNIIDEETEMDIGTIEATSVESLEEQLHKIPEMVDRYKELEKTWDEIDLNFEAEKHND